MTVERKSRRPEVAQRKRWYGTARWKRLRARVLANGPTCSVCHAVAADSVDHIEHRPDNSTFWDADNLRPVCKPCNSKLRHVADANAKRNGIGHRSQAWEGYAATGNWGGSTMRGGKERHTAPENDRIATLFERQKQRGK
ncbi:hypothetical protein GS610_20430 [Ruegeria sp. HKCCD6228]|nr:hypothetical protein [Ruegeria sp. HKCCD6228]